jgi:hypothetical protein
MRVVSYLSLVQYVPDYLEPYLTQHYIKFTGFIFLENLKSYHNVLV